MDTETKNVVITNIKMPFWSVVMLMVQWAIAAIPAFIILFFLAVFLMTLLQAMGHK